jgi:type IV pilus assembly protein PilO
MTNLQEGGSQLSGVWLRRFWLGLPIAVGGLLAFLVLATAVLPQWLALQRDMKRFSELEALRDQVARSRMQLQALDTAEEKTQALQAKLFEIVSGNGDLSTFMAMVDREAKLAGVQLDLFQPQPLTTPAKPGAPGAAASPAAPGTATGQPPAGAQAGRPGQPGEPPAPANTEIKGLRATTILLHARGPYPALVNFLHRIELLNVLVVQSNLVLEAVNKTDGSAPGAPQSREQPVLMKLQLMLYGREAPATPPAGAAAAGQPRIAAPPPAIPRPGAPPTPSTTLPTPTAPPRGNAPSTPSPTPTPPPAPAAPTTAPAR